MPTKTLRVTFRLHRAQREFRRSNALYRGFVGGIGSGKSYVGALDLIRRAQPSRLYAALAPTYPMMRDASLRSFTALARELHYLREFRRSEMAAILGNGAEVLFRSTDDPERLRGPNLSGVWMDEASLMAAEARDITIGRLREGGQQGWLSATFTPKGRQHWTYQMFGMGQPNTALFHARTGDNPHLPRTFDATLRAQYTSTFAAQELGGEFVDSLTAVFRREWFQLVDAAPAGLECVRAWDMAATEPKDHNDPDYTVGTKVGKTKDGVYCVLDVRRDRLTPRGVEQMVRRTAEEDGRTVPVLMEQEPGASGVNLIDHYMRYVLAGWSFHGEKPTGDKVTRAMPFAAQAEAGNVRIVRAPWNKAWLDEFEGFPLGAHDDQVDSASQAFARLTLNLPKPFQVWT